ncbi:MAG TPA: BON domain-containing protein [Longimicrobiaceae bacterium]|nr:BON domain-containing protein [Longimicrobiaceae bacterium]
MATDRGASEWWRLLSRPRLRVAASLPLLLLLGCARPQIEPPLVVDTSLDLRIQREVEARLVAEPAIASGEIRVEVSGGTVELHGSVRGIGAYQCALRNASLVDGVARVAAYLIIERGPRDVPCLAPRRIGERSTSLLPPVGGALLRLPV